MIEVPRELAMGHAGEVQVFCAHDAVELERAGSKTAITTPG